MIPPLFGALVGPAGGASFIGAASFSAVGLTATVTLPSGTAAGDYCMIFIAFFLGTPFMTGGTGAGWTLDTLAINGNAGCLHKQLASGDITTLTVNGIANTAPVQVVIYRGPALATKKSSVINTPAGSTVTIPGITKAALSKGLVANAVDNALVAANTVTQPVGWASRVKTGAPGQRNIADYLTPASYVTGSSVIFTGLKTSEPSNGGLLFELT